VATAANAAASSSSVPSSARYSEEGGGDLLSTPNSSSSSSPFSLTSAASVCSSARRCLATLVRCVPGSREALSAYFERECAPAERAALLPLALSLLSSYEEKEEGEGAAAARLLGEMRLSEEEEERKQPTREEQQRQQPSEVQLALQRLREATGRGAAASGDSSSVRSPAPHLLAPCLREIEALAAANGPSSISSPSSPSSVSWDRPSVLETLAASASALLSAQDPRAREAAARVVGAFAATRPEVLLLPSSSSVPPSSSPEQKLLLEALVPRLAVAAGLDDDARVRFAAWEALEGACCSSQGSSYSFEPVARALSSALRFVSSEGEIIGGGGGGIEVETGEEEEDQGDASAAIVAVLRASEAAVLRASDFESGSLFPVAVTTGLFAGAAKEASTAKDAGVRLTAVKLLAALWGRGGAARGEIEAGLPRATGELVRLYASRKG